MRISLDLPKANAIVPDFRTSQPSDNAQILKIFEGIPMKGDVTLTAERGPEFEALYDLQRGESYCVVREDEESGELDAIAALLIREGWLDGQKAKVGYLGDLRTAPTAQAARAVAKTYGALFDTVSEHSGCEVFLTSIMSSNERAINALVDRSNPKRKAQPFYHEVKRFDTLTVHLAMPALPYWSKYTVRTATQQDIPAIASFLAEDHAKRVMGYDFDNGEFEHRLATWPGFTLDDTYLAFDKGGALVGVTTAWDAHPVKRYRVDAYQGGMKRTQQVMRFAGKALGTSALPEEGEAFRYVYLANLSIHNDDPAILRALTTRIHKDFRKRGYHFYSLPLDKQDPLQPAMKGYAYSKLGFNLYAVSRAADPRTQFSDARTGFDIALA